MRINNTYQSQLCSNLSLSTEDLALLTTFRMYNHTCSIWNAFKHSWAKDATAHYSEFWARSARKTFVATLQKLQIDSIPDVEVLGKIVADIMSCGPTIYLIKVNNSKLHVGHVLWCANPGTNKTSGTRFCGDDYFRAEGNIAHRYINTFVEEAKKYGLQKEVIVEIKSARCNDCFSTACQYILRDADAMDMKLPEANYEIIDETIGYEKPLITVLEQANISCEMQSENALAGYFAMDHSAWSEIFSCFGEEAPKHYNRIWSEYALTSINELKLSYKLGEACESDKLVDKLLLHGLNNVLILCNCLDGVKRGNYEIDLRLFMRAAENNPDSSKKYLGMVVEMIKAYIKELFRKSEFENLKITFNDNKIGKGKLLFEIIR